MPYINQWAGQSLQSTPLLFIYRQARAPRGNQHHHWEEHADTADKPPAENKAPCCCEVKVLTTGARKYRRLQHKKQN